MSWHDEKMIMDYIHLGTRVDNLDETIVEIYAILEKNKISPLETMNLFKIIADIQDLKIMGFGEIYAKIDERLQDIKKEKVGKNRRNSFWGSN